MIERFRMRSSVALAYLRRFVPERGLSLRAAILSLANRLSHLLTRAARVCIFNRSVEDGFKAICLPFIPLAATGRFIFLEYFIVHFLLIAGYSKNGAQPRIIDLLARDGKRMSVFRAYVFPYMDRPNLTVLTHALVTRLTFDGKRATGVEITYDGKTHRIEAGIEVTLSLGAIQTPKVLMQSGLGDQVNCSDSESQSCSICPAWDRTFRTTQVLAASGSTKNRPAPPWLPASSTASAPEKY
jgi:GMC oxidoreductase